MRDFNDKKPLHVAVQAGHTEIVKYLVEEVGYSINELDKSRKTALNYACESGNEEIANFLLEQGGIINDKIPRIASLFCEMAANGELDKLRLYGKCGANLMIGDYDNRTIAHIAADKNQTKIIQFLVEETNFNIMVKDNFGNLPTENCNETVKSVIQRKFSIIEAKSEDDEGRRARRE